MLVTYLRSAPQRADMRQHLLDALPEATAVVNRHGVITAVNRAWTSCGAGSKGVQGVTGAGVNYLQVCDQAAAAGWVEAASTATELRAVLRGDRIQGEVEYQTSGAGVQRWFLLRMTPITGLVPGALISHLEMTAQRSAEQALCRSAARDPLTGLANKALLLERLTDALTPRAGQPEAAAAGLLLLAVNDFARLNETFGHEVGDQMLTGISHQLQTAARSEDTIARIGDGRFAMMAPHITGRALVSVAQNLTEALGSPQVINGHTVQVSASIGMHLAAAGSDAAHVLAAADAAMYRRDNTIGRFH